MILGGIFERHPTLRVGSVGNAAAWIPRWLSEMDELYLRSRGSLRLGMRPSQYWHRNLFVEFSEDVHGIRLRDEIGIDNMLWGGICPWGMPGGANQPEVTIGVLAGIPQQDRKKITFDNAAKMFGFPRFASALAESSARAPSLASVGAEARSDALSEVESSPEASIETPRRVNAWVEDADGPLILSRTYRFCVNVGKLRADALASAALPGIDWGERQELDILVVLGGGDFRVTPRQRPLTLPKSGDTKPVEFAIRPLVAPSALLRVSLYLAHELLLLEEFEISIRVDKAAKVA
jgi:hypothetical protein